MAVLTESALRLPFIANKFKESVIKLPNGTILTPAAKIFLQDRKITVEFFNEEVTVKTNNKKQQKTEQEPTNAKDGSKIKYQVVNGGFMEDKPEYMTTLSSNLLVPKNHRRIILRGKLDALQAKIM